MSASLIVMVPIVLLGLVTALCFVGCGLMTHGLGLGFGPYEDPISNNSNCVACWPLNDAPPSTTAIDIKSGLNGNYMGSVALVQAGIVAGDFQNGPTPCASFGGGVVQVNTPPGFSPSQTFTIECWVQPAWPVSDANVHAVVVTTDLNANTGYALFCDATNVWTGNIGLGMSNGFLLTVPAATSQPATAGTTFYLALTFDGTNLNLFVNPTDTMPYAQAPLPMGAKFTASAASLPLFIGLGRPDLPPGQLPFIGKIQDVAFYSPALGIEDVLGHFALGNTPPG